MPFLDVAHSDSAGADSHSSAKALKASKMATQQNGAVLEQISAENSNGEVEARAQQMVLDLPIRPTSSPSSPKLTIAKGPSRLTSFHPPPNYGMVEKGTIFRSGFPKAKHLEFMEELNIRSILSLVDTEPCEEFHLFMDVQGIQRNHLSIAANKEGGKMDVKTICDAIIFAKDTQNQPVHIHCNQGKHRTGCVVACLRKYQGRSMDEILTEYKAYAYPKERPGDIEFIKAFDPEMVDAYAKCYAHSGMSPKDFRVDSKLDICELSASIPDNYANKRCSTGSMSSSYDSGSDVMMMSSLPPAMGSIIGPWTQVRDFGDPHGKHVRHDNEAPLCSADVISGTLIGCMDIGDGDSEWDESETTTISATATTSPIVVSARSSSSS